jgi:biopolymer transport protein ExbD
MSGGAASQPGSGDAGQPRSAPAPAPAAAAAARRRRTGPGFRRRDAASMHDMHFGPNMTPMVDIVMVILIFFMASAAFLGNEWFLRAALPMQAGKGNDPKKPNDALALPAVRLDVIMESEPGTGATLVSFLELKRVSIDRFRERVNALPDDEQTRSLEVVVRPAASVPYREVVRVYETFDAKSITKLGTQGLSSVRPAAPAATP